MIVSVCDFSLTSHIIMTKFTFTTGETEELFKKMPTVILWCVVRPGNWALDGVILKIVKSCILSKMVLPKATP